MIFAQEYTIRLVTVQPPSETYPLKAKNPAQNDFPSLRFLFSGKRLRAALNHRFRGVILALFRGELGILMCYEARTCAINHGPAGFLGLLDKTVLYSSWPQFLLGYAHIKTLLKRHCSRGGDFNQSFIF